MRPTSGNLLPRACAVLCATWALCTCASDAGTSTGTSVVLEVRFEESWGLDALGVSARDRLERVAATHELLLVLPNRWAGEELHVELDGFRASERYAHGEVTVTPELDTEVWATVTLTRLPCGAWCTEGATQCEGDGVVVCEQRDDDACMEWSEVVPCSTDAPYCSLGMCDAECFDECAEHETRCDGPDGVRLCGQGDTDPCLDWLAPIECGEGEHCSGGACTASCHDECGEGAVRCGGAGTAICGDLNFDGCTEWGPATPCPDGESCSGGSCAPISSCENECEASTCDGLMFTRCGNYDLDPCTEPSPGTSCVPTDACFEGRCTPSGCATSPRVCTEPPASECVDSGTLRVYDTSGACEAGNCVYNYDDRSCPNCPSCDACAGVTCSAPPSECYETAGSCAGGSCTYAYDDGADCDDGNACTTRDSCERGVCGGRPKICDAPPAPTCVATNRLRTYSGPGACAGGNCVYPHGDTMCPGECADGTCAEECTLGTWGGNTLDSVGDVGAHPSLVFDESGGTHASYYDQGEQELVYAYWLPGERGVTSTVDSSGNVGHFTSLALDGAGGAHIGYYDVTRRDLKYAHRPSGGSWTTHTIDSAGRVGKNASLGLDDAGGVHISYYDETNLDLKYAYKPPSGGWSTVTVESSGQVGAFSSLAVDDAGGVHISYYDELNAQLRYAYRPSGGTWATVTADSRTGVGAFTSLALDGAGGVHISYYDVDNRDLAYAYMPLGGTFTSRTIDFGDDVGVSTSLAIGRDGGVHISYYDFANSALNYAHKPPGGSWVLYVLDSEGVVGQFSSIALDEAGEVHILYYDRTNGDLDHAVRSCL